MTTRSTSAAQAALDAELERIVELDRIIRAAQAEQYRRIEVARSHAAEVEGVIDGSPAVAREFATRAFVAELATTLVMHEATAGRLVTEAGRLVGEFPAALDALASGSVCVGRVRSLLEIATTLPQEVAAEFESAALELVHAETPSAFRRRIRRLRERMHPELLSDRRERARVDRRVCLDPAEDGMAWLSLFLEAERGAAIMAHLDALAGARLPSHASRRPDANAGGGVCDDRDDGALDRRTRAQLMLDFATDLMLGRRFGPEASASGSAPGSPPASSVESPLGVVTPKVYVTVPVLTLLGHSDQPAELDGYGPIDAETARRLAAHAPSFHRILTHPETGATLSYGRASYRVPADLAGFLRVRDGGCRFPGCSRRAAGCDIDHTLDWAAGGLTRHDNLAHLCRKHHRLKHETGLRMSQQPSGDIRWVSPAGREYVSTPARPFPPPPTAVPGAAGAPDDDVVPPWAVPRVVGSAAA